MVITELPPESAKDALDQLCSSVVTPLQVSSVHFGFISTAYSCFWLTMDHFCDTLTGSYQPRSRSFREETCSRINCSH